MTGSVRRRTSFVLSSFDGEDTLNTNYLFTRTEQNAINNNTLQYKKEEKREREKKKKEKNNNNNEEKKKKKREREEREK